jgi:YD repeat-containing protein
MMPPPPSGVRSVPENPCLIHPRQERAAYGIGRVAHSSCCCLSGIPQYDAAGNMTNDGLHQYIYDAEGNIVAVFTENGATVAAYVYDAQNRRVRSAVSGNVAAQYAYDAKNHRAWAQTGGATTEYVFDYAGRRISSWAEPSNVANEGRIYWDGRPLAYRSSDSTTYFQHQDYLGTERMRTNYSGAMAASFTSLPWGDGYAGSIPDAGAGQETFQSSAWC